MDYLYSTNNITLNETVDFKDHLSGLCTDYTLFNCCCSNKAKVINGFYSYYIVTDQSNILFPYLFSTYNITFDKNIVFKGQIKGL